MQHQLNISKISAISYEFVKGKVTLCEWEKTSIVEQTVYINKHIVTLRAHGFLPGPLLGRSVRIDFLSRIN